jgi:hypothetical protein
MNLTTVNNEILDNYYKNRQILLPCNQNSNTNRYGVTPYNGAETIYWAIKHFALHGIIFSLITAIVFVFNFIVP